MECTQGLVKCSNNVKRMRYGLYNLVMHKIFRCFDVYQAMSYSLRRLIILFMGITEAGTVNAGNIKSSLSLGILLYQGIGDTIRVSLTGSVEINLPSLY